MPIPRVPEPEVMDSHQEATDYDTMDHSAVNQRFVEDLLAAGAQASPGSSAALATQFSVQGDCLDVGAGTAQIPVALCEAAEGFRVAALDMSTAMLDVAVYNLELAGLTDRIALIHGDAKEMPFADGAFHVVFSNSIVHHIPEPLEVLRESIRVTAPEGWLFFRDLLRPDTEEELQRLVDTYAAECNDHQRQMFAESLRSAFTLDELAERIESLGGDPQRQLKATSDRHWTWVAGRSELKS
ncbi:MAG: class I SAM-dependent methyltransferase [Planctomycetales bacterium]|nr:class I SAM-dependent methyltransferase [Planctomycetales bacterium]